MAAVVITGTFLDSQRGCSGVRRLRWSAAVVVVALASGCAARVSGPSSESIDPESLQVVGVSAFVEVPSKSVFVAPDGSAWVYWSGEELCVGRRADPAAEPTCAPWDEHLPRQGVSWSSDATRVLFNQDFYQAMREPDVNVFDTETGQIDVLTDDGADDYRDDGSEIDLFPFFGPKDEVYFFRVSSDDRSVALYRVVDHGAEPVVGGQLGNNWPDGPVFRSGDDVWTFGSAATSDANEYKTLTFEGSDPTVSVEDLWEPTELETLTGAATDSLLTVSRPIRGQVRSAEVVFPEQSSSVELPAADGAVEAGFPNFGVTMSADGRHVLELRPSPGGRGADGRARFTVWRIDAEGGTVTAHPTLVGTVTDERIEGYLGIEAGTLGWDGATTITASESGGVIMFDVTSEES